MITGFTRGDDICPVMSATARERDQMIDGEMVGAFLHAAILAAEGIAQQDVFAAERDGPIRDADIPSEPNHFRHGELGTRRRNNMRGILNGMGDPAEEEFEGATSRANVNCLIR